MSGAHLTKFGNQRSVSKSSLHKDFSVATPEEFAARFGGTTVINKVNYYYLLPAMLIFT